VKKATLPPLFLVLIVLALSIRPASPQTRSTFPTPPEGQNHDMVEKPPATTTRHLDFEKLQNEADELARTAQTIPADVASVRKGMLPKDAVEKLKQIEKLSKRLRSELAP
jgi:hypothetical protein